MPESEAVTSEYFPFEDITGKEFLYTESEVRSMGYFHRHGTLVLPGIALRSDGSTVVIPPACPLCDSTFNKPWLDAWQARRLWAASFEALTVIRRIEEEYAASVLVESSLGCDLRPRVAGLLEGTPQETAE